MPDQSTIATRQNTPGNLELAAAALQAYALGKRIWYLQIFSVLASAIAGPILATTWPALRVWVAFAAVVITCLDLAVFEPLIKLCKGRGAKIQDKFDCSVFELNRDVLATGKDVADEDVIKLARRRRRFDQDDKQVRDWYPVVCGDIPSQLGRLICQRSSTRWDAALRRELTIVVMSALGVFLFAGSIFVLSYNMTVEVALLSVVVPMLPLFTRAWKECSSHRAYAQHSDDLREYIDELWPKAASGALSVQRLKNEARAIQTQLYLRRAAGPFVPTWYYKWRHKNYDDEMKAVAAKLVDAARHGEWSQSIRP